MSTACKTAVERAKQKDMYFQSTRVIVPQQLQEFDPKLNCTKNGQAAEKCAKRKSKQSVCEHHTAQKFASHVTKSRCYAKRVSVVCKMLNRMRLLVV